MKSCRCDEYVRDCPIDPRLSVRLDLADVHDALGLAHENLHNLEESIKESQSVIRP